MKKNLLMMAMVLLGTCAMANNVSDIAATGKGVAVVKQGKDVFRLIYKSESLNDVRVTIYGPSNEVILSDYIRKSDGFIRPYNFGGMQAGNYRVRIADKTGTHETFMKYDNRVEESQVNLVKYHDQEKYLLTVQGEVPEKLVVNIYDEAEHLLHNSEYEVAGNFSQLFTMKQIEGDITFEIIHENGNVKYLRKK